MSQLNPQISNSEDSNKITIEAEKLFDQYFNNLLNKSNINKSENKELATKYYDLYDNTAKLEKSRRTKNILKWIFIWLIFPYFILNNQIKNITPKIESQNKELNDLENRLQKQLEPLYKLYSSYGVIENVLNKSFEDFKFSPTLSYEHIPLWENFSDSIIPLFNKDKDFSICELVSGEMYSTPFIVAKGKMQSWIDMPYFKEVPIHYRTQNGTGTEMAMAIVYWPFPVYKINDYMAIKTNLVKNLSFIGNNEVKHHWFKRKNKDQLPMDNPEFDKKFACSRNDEQQFRVAFTVLTQEKIVNLLATYPDFVLLKDSDNVITYQKRPQFEIKKLSSRRRKSKEDELKELLNSDCINYSFGTLTECSSYDLDQMKDVKLTQINNFITRFSKLQSPFSCLPLFYREDYKLPSKNIPISSSIQSEAFVDSIYKKVFADVKFETNIIIETKQTDSAKISKEIHSFISNVTIKYFYSVPLAVPAVAVGAHGSRPTTVIVRDFKPKYISCYMLQINGIDKYKQKDFDNGKLANGTYYGLFRTKPTKLTIDKIINEIKK